jgi:hypothetical protein
VDIPFAPADNCKASLKVDVARDFSQASAVNPSLVRLEKKYEKAPRLLVAR